MENRVREITLKDVKIGTGAYRNFSGRKTQFNATGARKFVMFISEEAGEKLLAEGWNVKVKERPDRDDPSIMTRQYQLEAEVSYKNYPPVITLKTYGGNKKRITEDNVGELDEVAIAHADVTIGPFPWSNNGRSGIKAYVWEIDAEERAPRRAINAGFTRVENDEEPF